MSEVWTSRGPVRGNDLGLTLMHEHLFVNLLREYRGTGLLNHYETIREEVRLFKSANGNTIVDVTSTELTRGAASDPSGVLGTTTYSSEDGIASRARANVELVARLSEELDVNIVLGTGHYRDPYLDRDWFDRTSADRIADLMVRDLTEGINGTGIRAGIIGEIGADKWYVSAAEERSFRAAARAQKKTGVCLTTHAGRWPVGIQQLDILASEDVDPSRVVIGHCDSVRIPEYYDEIIRRGAFVQFDLMHGQIPEPELLGLIRLIREMINKGHTEKLLLSHDICLYDQLHAGGGRGYDFISSVLTPRLEESGVSADVIHELMVTNPRRALTGAA